MRLETRLRFLATVLLLLLTSSTLVGCSRPGADPALGYLDRIVEICRETIPHLEKDLKLAGKSDKEQGRVFEERAALARDIRVRVSALGDPPSDHAAVSDWLKALERVEVDETPSGGDYDDDIARALSVAAADEEISRDILGRASAAGLPECETRGWLLLDSG